MAYFGPAPKAPVAAPVLEVIVFLRGKRRVPDGGDCSLADARIAESRERLESAYRDFFMRFAGMRN
jgi:hypothetical protein